MSRAMAALVHMCVPSHGRDDFGRPTAWAVCIECGWVGEVRASSAQALEDGEDHSDGVQVTA